MSVKVLNHPGHFQEEEEVELGQLDLATCSPVAQIQLLPSFVKEIEIKIIIMVKNMLPEYRIKRNKKNNKSLLLNLLFYDKETFLQK